jgi:hypothetical protein
MEDRESLWKSQGGARGAIRLEAHRRFKEGTWVAWEAGRGPGAHGEELWGIAWALEDVSPKGAL